MGRRGLTGGPRTPLGRWCPLQALARAVQGLWRSLASLNSSILTQLLLLGAPPAADRGDAAGGAHHVHHLHGGGGGQPLLHHHGVPLLQARLVPPGLHPGRRPFPLPARRDAMRPERRPAHTGSLSSTGTGASGTCSAPPVPPAGPTADAPALGTPRSSGSALAALARALVRGTACSGSRRQSPPCPLQARQGGQIR